ncbi:hypothetical protein [Geomonas ferrireducens]|uniref:hypothetical protein n=1 Tax=Geomonas ferrireducens TaxID=2570227 RepID=UPI0010A7EFE1|nr:hypothetical protein [Geomonas ferrireducens]
MNSSQTVILGVVSGVITSGLLYLALTIFKAVILPWYQNVIYSGTQIAGEWYCYARDLAQNAKFELTQHANELKGQAVYIHADEGDVEIEKLRTFSVSGIIEERFVQLNLKHVDKTRIGLVSYLLEVKGDGRRMSGAGCYYEVHDCEVETTPLLFSRQPLSHEYLSDFWQLEDETSEDHEQSTDLGAEGEKTRQAENPPAIDSCVRPSPSRQPACG